MLKKLNRDYHYRVHLEEIFTVFLLGTLNTLILIYSDIHKAPILFFLNTALIIIISILPFINNRYKRPWFNTFRDLYIVLAGGFIFFEHHHLVTLINPHDVDELLIQVDRYLFLGNDPTILFESVTYPVITEFLQIIYTSYYFLPLSLIFLLYFKGRKSDFHTVTPTIMLGLYICYLGYYISPAIGPRFTLDHLQSFPLSGFFSYDFIRTTIDTFEGITRDCCPSGHTLVSVLTAMLAYKYYRPVFRAFSIWASLIVISTVYLRYHYVIDVIAGLIIAMIVFRFAPQMVTRYIYYTVKLKKEEKLVTDQAETSASSRIF